MLLAVDVLNEVLNYFGAPNIFENNDININKDLSLDNYLQFEICRNTNHVPITIIISGGDIRVDIDRTQATSEWPLNQIKNDKDKLISFLKILFKSYILVEYYGSSLTRISFFDEKGGGVDNYVYQNGLSFKGKRKDRLFFSIYQMSEGLDK